MKELMINGYYWVRDDDEWYIAEYEDGLMYLTGIEHGWKPETFDEIGELIITTQ